MEHFGGIQTRQRRLDTGPWKQIPVRIDGAALQPPAISAFPRLFLDTPATGNARPSILNPRNVGSVACSSVYDPHGSVLVVCPQIVVVGDGSDVRWAPLHPE